MLGLASGLTGGSALPDPYSKFSVSFNGTDEYVELGDNDLFSPNGSGSNRGFTVSTWVKIPSENYAPKQIITKTDQFFSGATRYEWQLVSDFAKRLKITIYSQGLDDSKKIIFKSIEALPMDQWVNIVFSWGLAATSSGFVAHINGVKHSVANENMTLSGLDSWVAFTNTPVTLRFARRGQTYSVFKMDDTAIFDDALSDAQAVSIYNSGRPGDISAINHLVGWWKMGDNEGSDAHPTLDDFSSNSNNGTMNNMAGQNITQDIA